MIIYEPKLKRYVLKKTHTENKRNLQTKNPIKNLGKTSDDVLEKLLEKKFLEISIGF